jgi:hypothetical protein
MQRKIHSALQVDRAAHTSQAGDSIITELAEGNGHGPFHHLKVWYGMATETHARPCFQTMEKQMIEHGNITFWSPNHHHPVNSVEVWDEKHTNGRCRLWLPN